MQLHVVKNGEGVPEWMIIDLQGVLDAGDRFDGKHLGDMAWRKDNSEALLGLGHHILEGKVSKLEKPLLVMAREGDDRFLVEAIVRRKLVFKTRPKPVVSKKFFNP